jgi:hypothetical protein
MFAKIHSSSQARFHKSIAPAALLHKKRKNMPKRDSLLYHIAAVKCRSLCHIKEKTTAHNRRAVLRRRSVV